MRSIRAHAVVVALAAASGLMTVACGPNSEPSGEASASHSPQVERAYGKGFSFALPPGWREVTQEFKSRDWHPHLAVAPASTRDDPTKGPFLFIARSDWCKHGVQNQALADKYLLEQEAYKPMIREPVRLGQVPASHLQGVWGNDRRPFDRFASTYTKPCWYMHFTHLRGGPTAEDKRAMQTIIQSWRFDEDALLPRP